METSSAMINKQTPKEDKIILVPELMEEVMKSDDNSEELEGGIFWKEFQRKMLRCKNFAEIVQIVDSTKIPDISLQRKTTMQPHDRQDQISQFLLPQDVDENLVPVMCKGDGNCFPRAISNLCFGTECRHREICCRMVIDQSRIFLTMSTMKSYTLAPSTDYQIWTSGIFMHTLSQPMALYIQTKLMKIPYSKFIKKK